MRDRLPMIVSITALLVALFGITPLGKAAYDAVVPRNSVGTLQLKRNAVKAPKIAPSAIRTGHVQNGSLLVADFKSGQLPQGPKGDKGDRGEPGPGATSFDTTVDVGVTDVVLATAAGVEVVARCSPGTGGFASVGIRTTPSTNTLKASGTSSSGSTVSAVNGSGFSGTSVQGAVTAGLNVIARNSAVGSFMRIDARIAVSTPCTAWGMITPSSAS
jgi:hypothetical protein